MALVTITPKEIGDKPGVSGKIGASLETKRGNTHKDNYKAALQLAYDNNTTSIIWLDLSGSYGESNDVKNTNKLYSHLRYIHALSDEDIRAEAFAQIQDDEFKLLERRMLGGAGLRYRMLDSKDYGSAYFGLGAFYENIEYTSDDPHENNVRISSYFAYTIPFMEASKFTYSLFYQPKIDDFADTVQSHIAQLKLRIYKKLFLNFRISYALDSKPPAGVEKYDFTQVTAFLFEF